MNMLTPEQLKKFNSLTINTIDETIPKHKDGTPYTAEEVATYDTFWQTIHERAIQENQARAKQEALQQASKKSLMDYLSLPIASAGTYYGKLKQTVLELPSQVHISDQQKDTFNSFIDNSWYALRQFAIPTTAVVVLAVGGLIAKKAYDTNLESRITSTNTEQITTTQLPTAYTHMQVPAFQPTLATFVLDTIQTQTTPEIASVPIQIYPLASRIEEPTTYTPLPVTDTTPGSVEKEFTRDRLEGTTITKDNKLIFKEHQDTLYVTVPDAIHDYFINAKNKHTKEETHRYVSAGSVIKIPLEDIAGQKLSYRLGIQESAQPVASIIVGLQDALLPSGTYSSAPKLQHLPDTLTSQVQTNTKQDTTSKQQEQPAVSYETGRQALKKLYTQQDLENVYHKADTLGSSIAHSKTDVLPDQEALDRAHLLNYVKNAYQIQNKIAY